MRYAQPEDIQIRKIGEAKYAIDICNKSDLACIERKGSHWFLELSDKKYGDASIHDVTNYFGGRNNTGISLESYISAWLMNSGIEV